MYSKEQCLNFTSFVFFIVVVVKQKNLIYGKKKKVLAVLKNYYQMKPLSHIKKVARILLLTLTHAVHHTP